MASSDGELDGLARGRLADRAVQDARAAWMRRPREVKDSDAGDALRAALRRAGDELSRVVLRGGPDDGMTDEERREAADEAGRECDFHI